MHTDDAAEDYVSIRMTDGRELQTPASSLKIVDAEAEPQGAELVEQMALVEDARANNKTGKTSEDREAHWRRILTQQDA